MKKKLTVKQQKFIDFYIESGNATDAAIKAGYSKKSAYSVGNENLKKPEIQNAVKARLAKLESAKIADITEVMQRLTAMARGETEEEVVVVEGCGDGESEARVIRKKVPGKEQVKALELLGRRYGLFTDNINLTDKIKLVIENDYGD